MASEGAGTQAVILLAHGSRDPLWSAPLRAVVEQIRLERPHVHAELAFLELCEPDLPTATRRLVAQGVHTLTLLPAFLGMGSHARQDIPELVARLRTEHPHLYLRLLPPAGEHPELIDLLVKLPFK